MRRVSSTEVQNNFGKYLLLAQEQEVTVTRNGQDVARLSGLSRSKSKDCIISEEVLSQGYGLRKDTYGEFLELTKDSEERYEYIDGEIFLQASPKVDHQFAVSELHVLFHQFFNGKPCRAFTAPFDITISRFEGDINVVQPDLMVICDLKENLGHDGYYHGVPDLIVEVLSPSTRRNDLLKKLNLYLDGGVKEYWAVDPQAKQITIYNFEDGDILSQVAYKTPEKAQSVVFLGLSIDLSRIFLSL